MKRKYLKRWLAFSLATLVTLTSVPVNALALESDNGVTSETEENSSEDLETPSSSSETTTTSESEEVENSKDAEEATNYVASSEATEEAEKQDFSSKELIVKIGDSNMVKADAVSGNYDNVYLMKYDTETEAKDAYMYYYDNTADDNEFVAVNAVFGIATDTDETKVEEDVTVEDIEYDEDTTSLNELTNAVKSDEQISLTGLFTPNYSDMIALIDTGSNDADEAVSMLGEDTSDENGHGTKMLEYMKEVNKDAHVLSIKALDGKGHGDASSIYSAIEYAVSKNAKVINLSLYGYNTKDNAAIVSAIKDATDAGITVVGAAGNGGNDVKNYLPGNIKDIIVVGACDENGTRIAKSNYGETVDYNVVAGSTSEATAKMSGFVALNGVSGIDEVLNQGLIYATDYVKSEEKAEEKTDEKTEEKEVEISEDGKVTVDGKETSSSSNGFFSATDLDWSGVTNVSGFHYTLNMENIDFEHTTITSGGEYFEKAIHDNGSSGTLNAGIFSTWEPFNSSSLKEHTWYTLPGGDDGFTIVCAGGAKSSQGNKDLEIHVSGIQARYCGHLAAWRDDNADVSIPILAGSKSDLSEAITANYIFSTPILTSVPHSVLALRFSISYRVVDAGDNEKLALLFEDLDQSGCTDAGSGSQQYLDGWDYDGYESGIEGIQVMNGVEKAWVQPDSVLRIDADNGRFYGTQTTTGTDEVLRSTVSLLGSAGGTEVRWSGTACATGMGGLGNLLPSYTANLYVRYQNTDGSWPSDYWGPVWTSGSMYAGSTITGSWTDYTSGYSNISGGTGKGLSWVGKTAYINIGALYGDVNCYIDIPRNAVTGTTYVRYQNTDGSWGSWSTVHSASVSVGGKYSYTYTKPNNTEWGTPTSTTPGVSCNSNGATVSKNITSNTGFYISVPRTQRTYSFNYNLPKAVTDSGFNESSLRSKGYLKGTQNAFTHYYGANADTVTTISLDGYQFKGWNTKADGTGSWYTDTDGKNPGSSHKIMTSNKTFYAIWINGLKNKPIVTVKVRYQKADGSWGSYETLVNAQSQNMYSNYSYTYNVADNQKAIYAKKIDVARENSNSGNTCSMTDNDSTTATVGITKIIRNETFLISIYRKTYTVKTEVRYEQIAPMSSNQVDYSGQKGNWNAYATIDTKDIFYGATYSYQYNQITGDEWSTSKCTTTSQTGKSFIISGTVTGNKTYQVEVPRARYTVIYDKNANQDLTWQEGEKKQNVVNGTMANSQYVYDLSGKLRTNTYTREGYEFVGWNTKADGTGTSFKDGYTGVLKWAKDGGSVTLYAQWQKKLGTETLTVVSEETGKPVSGVTVQLYKDVNGKKVAIGDPLTTNADGKVVVNELHWFDYTWNCVSVPSGYKNFTDITFGINYNHLTNEDSVILNMKHVKLTIDSKVSEIIKGESAPSFIYHVEGTDAAGVKHSYNIMVDVDGNTLNGSNATKDMFAGTYTITETSNERYVLGEIRNVENCSVDNRSVTANLLNNTEAEVEYPYYIHNYGWFTSMHSEVNELTK